MTTEEFIDSIIPSQWEYSYSDLVKVVEAEREACWEIACYYTQKFNSHPCLAVADEIRARGTNVQ